jgi:subtilase family serine protease
MLRTRTFAAAASATAVVAGMTIVGASGIAGASSRPADTTLRGSVAPFTATSRVIGNLPASTRLAVQVWLRPRTAAAERFATAVSTPGSRQFRHYLSPAGYTARFAATRTQAGKVAAWLRSQGFTSVHADSGRSYVIGTGSARQAEAAFRTRIRQYRSSASVNAGPYVLHANSTPVKIPASLASSVIGVTGLQNAAPKLPLMKPRARSATAATAAKPPKIPCSAYYGQKEVGGLPRAFGTTTFPTYLCGYKGSQYRSVYGSNNVNTGKGQTIALVELGLTQDMFTTLKDYAKTDGLPAPSAERYSELSLGQGTACGDAFDIEEQLDVEASYDMAPAANQLVVGGDSCASMFGLQGLFDADLAVLGGSGSHPLATIASNSWGSGGENQPPAWTNVENAYLVRAVGEGVGMYFSSSDGSGNAMPSADPFTTSVGGTTLGISKAGTRVFETGWSDGFGILNGKSWENVGENGAGGGGPSQLWTQPAYQKGVVPAALAKAPGNRPGLVRSAPDISADGDEFTGFAVGLLSFPKGKPAKYGTLTVGGTSISSPLVAGMVAAAQQGQSHAFGFLNPVLYRLPRTAFSDPLPVTSHSPVAWRGLLCSESFCGIDSLSTTDDQSYSMYGYTGQVTLKGYDNMTGLGTPNGQSFITALRKLAG